jgi:hypothetical protein
MSFVQSPASNVIRFGQDLNKLIGWLSRATSFDAFSARLIPADPKSLWAHLSSRPRGGVTAHILTTFLNSRSIFSSVRVCPVSNGLILPTSLL